MSFDLVVVGCGGGPSELNLSSYFFKARHLSWEQGILAVEAGSGLGALREILTSNPSVFDTLGVPGAPLGGPGPVSHRAASIYSLVRTFLISHAHFDHVSGLVIGAGATSSDNVRYVSGLPSVIRDLQTVFDGQKLWPRLVRQRNEPKLSFAYTYDPITPLTAYRNIAPGLSTQLFPISHGSTTQGVYDSTAFFIRNDKTSAEFLFFGDVEPDSISSQPRNRAVWAAAADKIVQRRLTHVFLECSYRAGRSVKELFGHLSPEHVVDEIKALAREVVRARAPPAAPSGGIVAAATRNLRRRRRSTVAGAAPGRLVDADLGGTLAGMTLVVIHCKESMPPEEPCDDIRAVICAEVEALLQPLALGISVIAARQGMRLAF